MNISTSSANLTTLLPVAINGISTFFAVISSAFFGGLFAGLWTNHFESKRKINDKRYDSYYDHRNTIVQTEHELIPLRVNISRNNNCIDDAISNTHETNVRFILRFYKIFLSTGLGLKLLNLDLINKYSELYSEIESFNSDIQYISGMVTSIMDDNKAGRIDDSKILAYKVFLPQLSASCNQIDQKSLELLAMCKLAIINDEKDIKDNYIKNGKEIKYNFDKKSLAKVIKNIKDEEKGSLYFGEAQPKFVAPFLDLKKIVINTIPLK